MGRGLDRLSGVPVKAITGEGMHSDRGGLYFQVSAGHEAALPIAQL
jgi:hypothetical protein